MMQDCGFNFKFNLMRNLIVACFAVLSLHTSCSKPEKLYYIKLSGFAQGTSYHITYGMADSINLSENIDSILRDFDMSLSAWEPNSLLSRINRNETDIIDEKFYKTYEVAERVFRESEGAFDLTVMPLVNAWGFGPGDRKEVDSLLIDSLLQFVGMQKVRIEGNQLVKSDERISIDVNAIAQGYSVDIVAEYLEMLGCVNYMVEIGGEVRTRGKNAKAKVWRIGIDRPEFGNNLPGMNLQAIVELKDRSLTTSGNYRKFYEENGIKYTHSIDPKTGYPAKQQLLSATIISSACIDADAYATACMVSGLDKSIQMLEKLKDIDAYLIYSAEDGSYQIYQTPGMAKMLVE